MVVFGLSAGFVQICIESCPSRAGLINFVEEQVDMKIMQMRSADVERWRLINRFYRFGRFGFRGVDFLGGIKESIFIWWRGGRGSYRGIIYQEEMVLDLNSKNHSLNLFGYFLIGF
jgi:hypothetical protein